MIIVIALSLARKAAKFAVYANNTTKNKKQREYTKTLLEVSLG